MATVEEIEAKFTSLLANLSLASQKKLGRNIGRRLAQSQRNRIAEQKNPDGTPFTPRKQQKNLRNKKGRIKRKAMFAKLKTARFLKAKTNANQVNIGFFGSIAAIAEIHQYGLEGQVHRKRNYKVKYAQRELLGFTEQDIEMIERLVIEQLGLY
ncbi:phage virion morphogenesis protein [Pasteurella multocida]